ncbi:methyltransferase domain-containing protein [Pseudomonas sp. 21LCFQ02]|uniref:methyltransferase domain-containing protein n=1 Tax=Pseudomonas sp. 21LCFQ02 TaxID=2957505 RepID=UPI00209B5D88|nr:methyltransferase domain-containing protein [Pseudomonas sp. 21LCFQ02]MCO8167303.1 methyltransferase domain-containing protein [Pseudomonas sp. 21LCFQ02]
MFRTHGMNLAYKYCVGEGLELGASIHNSFYLSNCPNLSPSDGTSYLFERDLLDYQRYQANYIDHSGGEMAPVDLIGDFQNIPKPDASLDYLVSSHVIEHDPNTFAAFIESDRVLKNFGVFFCIFPKRIAAQEDRFRRLTTLEEMIAAHDSKLGMSDMPPETWRDHYQVFSLQSMIRVVNHLNQQRLGKWLIECVEETDSKVGNGHTIVLRKYDQLAESRWPDDESFARDFFGAWEAGRPGEALAMLKISLSFNFFDPVKLHLAGHLAKQIGDTSEAIEFLRQALIIEPENEAFRKEFFEWSGAVYANPVL